MILSKTVKCGYCIAKIKGGTFIEGKKRTYICSGKCLDAYEKEKKEK